MAKSKNNRDYYKPKLVMSIHGWLSTGSWQEVVSKAIEESGLISKEFKYGLTVRFDKWKINSLIDDFKEWYFDVCDKSLGILKIHEPYHRPSIVAHSLGTLIVVRAMQKYPEIKFDKMFLHGAIIPRDFDWYSLIFKDQISKVITSQSKKDNVVRLSFIMTGSLYPCCRHDFLQVSSFLKYEDLPRFKHSDFQYKERFLNQFTSYLYDAPLQLKVLDGKDIDKKGLTKYFSSTLRIDRDIYGEEYFNNNPVTIERALKWADIEKNIWSFVVDSYTGKVIGYINTIALNEVLLGKFLEGQISENDIHTEDIHSFNSDNKINLIVMSIALNSETYTKSGSVLSSKEGELLIAILANKILSITNNGKKLKSITAIGWTGVGQNLSESFGLQRTEHKYMNFPIFHSKKDELSKLKSENIRETSRWWLKQLKNG